jgi:Domain of unknown function (DUF4389)
VKWLLAIPHLLIIGAISTGGYATDRATGGDQWSVQTPGLLSICGIIAAFAVLFTNRYPRGLFDFVMGMNRWVLRVAAYVALMSDVYPPFRLDQGPDEPRPTTSDERSAV